MANAIEMVSVQNLVASFCCPWKRHFTAFSSARRSYQKAVNFDFVSKNFNLTTISWHVRKHVQEEGGYVTDARTIVPPIFFFESGE